ncbi:hypothetical protein [Paracraurococcus lichenis]|uniref:Uncharacterized protein n=1 Tax=Paracraurococcus lichenis TaxID=3064888 RepID=A0ABT9E4E5_9PROT|nr:hypothetical protein [Paracraurococcus sp. LOR1-02]MDO9711043.1 hypothetical protein [Paracraurococcus sp. LOR1-02]
MMTADFRSISAKQVGELLFIGAKEAAKRSREQAGTFGENIEAMTAVTLCVTVAEAVINELCHWFEFHRYRLPFEATLELPQDFDRLELRQKWQLFPIVVRQRSFDRSTEPWQSFDALIELRNYVVHPKRRAPPKKAAGVIVSKLKTRDFGHEVARWACTTMFDMIREMTRLIEPPPEWIGIFWRWTPTYFPPGLSTPGNPEGPA